jgi:hypothetical protein
MNTMVNQHRSHLVSGSTVPYQPGSLPMEPICAAPGCTNVVQENWDETGRLCGRCAIEEELFDRESRWDRVFPDRRPPQA